MVTSMIQKERDMRGKGKAVIFAVVSYLLVSCPATSIAAADIITLKGDKHYEGTFEAFKSNRFYFQPKEGKKLHEPRMMVELLVLQPSAKVSVKPRGKKKRDDLKLKGYENANFIFDKNGETITMPGFQVTKIEMDLDFSRGMQDTAPCPIPGKKTDIEVEKLVTNGVVTIIHFHVQTQKLSPNVRQENYVSSLEKKDKVAVVKIELSDWGVPAAKKYNINSSPQFWFYNRKGKLVKKLIDRFTGEDIDKALKEALR